MLPEATALLGEVGQRRIITRQTADPTAIEGCIHNIYIYIYTCIYICIYVYYVYLHHDVFLHQIILFTIYIFIFIYLHMLVCLSLCHLSFLSASLSLWKGKHSSSAYKQTNAHLHYMWGEIQIYLFTYIYYIYYIYIIYMHIYESNGVQKRIGRTDDREAQ